MQFRHYILVFTALQLRWFKQPFCFYSVSAEKGHSHCAFLMWSIFPIPWQLANQFLDSWTPAISWGYLLGVHMHSYKFAEGNAHTKQCHDVRWICFAVLLPPGNGRNWCVRNNLAVAKMARVLALFLLCCSCFIGTTIIPVLYFYV